MSLSITGIQTNEDFFLVLNSNNAQFPAFVRLRCGFYAKSASLKVWIRKNDFISEQNIAHMNKMYELILYSS